MSGAGGVGGEDAFVGLDQGFRDGQANPGAAVVAVPGGVAAVEALEDVRQLFTAYALARVGNADGDVV